jgi:hypothetical protein
VLLPVQRHGLVSTARRALAMSSFVLAGLSSGSARAQGTADEVRAQTLFDVARQLRDGGQLADACPMFARSKELALGVGVTLHLADCYERMGRTASAWDQFRQAETLAHERGDEKRADVARERARALEPRLERLTVAASSAPHDGWQVLVDGAALPASMWNLALALDPGDHVVTVTAPGRPTRTLRAHLDAAISLAIVTIDEPTAPASVAMAIAPPAPEPVAAESAAPPQGQPISARTWLGAGLVAVGLTGVGFGTAFLVRRSQLMNNSNACDTPQNEDDTAVAATIAFAAGGTALLSAFVLFLSAPTSMQGPRPAMGWSLAPAPLRGGGGAVVRASF